MRRRRRQKRQRQPQSRAPAVARRLQRAPGHPGANGEENRRQSDEKNSGEKTACRIARPFGKRRAWRILVRIEEIAAIQTRNPARWNGIDCGAQFSAEPLVGFHRDKADVVPIQGMALGNGSDELGHASGIRKTHSFVGDQIGDF